MVGGVGEGGVGGGGGERVSETHTHTHIHARARAQTPQWGLSLLHHVVDILHHRGNKPMDGSPGKQDDHFSSAQDNE